ncbi:hypothetical protein ABFX02_06G016400 [Erythranthe guttata]
MGKNNGNSWLNAVKKAFRSPANDGEKRSISRRRDDNDHEEEEKKRGKRRWIFRKNSPLETTIQHNVAKGSNSSTLIVSANTQDKEANLVANSCVSDQRRAVETAQQAAVDTIRLRRSSLYVEERRAAVRIQAIFRGYLARRALLALKGVVKLQALVRGYNVRKRAKMTLQCIQSLVRVQSLVCDQRRRLSCEANSVSRNTNRLSCNPHSLDEIQTLIDKAEECSLRQRNTLAHILSNQIRTLGDEDQFPYNNYQEFEEEENKRFSGSWKTNHPETGVVRKDRNLCVRTDPIKTVEIDTSSPYLYTSPRTPSSSKIESVKVHSCSPRHRARETNYQTAETPTSRSIYLHRMSMSESSCSLPQPSYMAATASAIARVRSLSTPRQRPNLSPRRGDQTGSSAKKRLSFPVPEHAYINADDKPNIQTYKGFRSDQFGQGQRSNVTCYYTE